ncbi:MULTISPECIES: hypothetical protein [Rossellomorea]|uniref:Uncharacterized protein n=1 Tax=Rossellomorea aquimaris TaxID=189382 RepID=A0A5D4UAW3_9BACI|nr:MULTISPECIES: hypothetical protein [Rossellomorea]MDT9024203.1 hypothetical protein [Rossellomorea sp. YC4-1]TYS78831.1 hypothetical protein FZD05_09850 [Rossellomorea aquimaris]TYS84576.1 hypothetical protein FZC85_14480 [Rossellomorea aquimaris]TYS91507.1 hypothetical protein FZC88_05005 [Rossellomorea aquimaris]
MEKIKQNKLIYIMFSFTSVINFLVFWLDPKSYMYLVISLIFFMNACVFFINSREQDGDYWRRWETIRNKGKWFFSVVYGSLFTGLVFSVILYVVVRDYLPLLIVCCVAGGWVWGYIMWMLNEKRYNFLKK